MKLKWWLKYKVLWLLDTIVIAYVRRRFLGEARVGVQFVKYGMFKAKVQSIVKATPLLVDVYGYMHMAVRKAELHAALNRREVRSKVVIVYRRSDERQDMYKRSDGCEGIH